VGKRPRILVTFGSVFAAPERLNPLLRALSATGAGVRTPVGIGSSAGQYDVDRAAVDLVPFAPLHDLLDGIGLVFCHGGAGTVLGSLAEGLPMVVVPQGADQFKIADLAVAAGAAVKLLQEDLTPVTIAEAVVKMVAGPAYAAGARRIAQEISLMPAPDDVARQLTGAGPR
jgi:UDP:flavonoid glycosyltransferase YjiC (YdhE family)